MFALIDSVEWDGSGYWWETEHFDEAVILKMVNDDNQNKRWRFYNSLSIHDDRPFCFSCFFVPLHFLIIAINSMETSQIQMPPYDGNYPQHQAYGTGIGAMPGRVVWSSRLLLSQER